MEPLYIVNQTCPACGTGYSTSRVRPSFKRSHHVDTDFCRSYRQINPDYYAVRVCPACGYAFSEHFAEPTDAQREQIRAQISAGWQRRDYGGERSWQEALDAYKLALLCAQLKDEPPRVVANLLHHIAWLYREQRDEAQEKRFLAHALEAYLSVFETERVVTDSARLLYLLGELNRRLGRFAEAVRWFSRVVNDQSIVDATMIRASREQWAAVREEMRAAGVEEAAEK
ncbi:hypothetical protein J31TS4_40780 [Paenibacillus sp. J31TS4]|uniref:DUF2225 domain-containing protein n=1 Tax=Paenibacillus sp. J31TS4 TaxID=2807195 RepID=UPI001B23154D|nr:DUF2225 domain-containing protein [Paenibacillus sp. J31TS4]GIP40798.1 hypothetical protein J31TS4_40780 [Paenibacillus sp. J31TS4]